MKTVAFIPIKMNSERLPLKNIKKFRNGKPLISYILDTIVQVKNIDEIYVYCSSDEICEYLPAEVKFLKRDSYFDLSSTSFNEVMESFCRIIRADVYVLAHATAPFISAKTIEKGVRLVQSGEYDSALTVSELKEFLWMEGKPLNYSLDSIPRTQDLPSIYTETCGLYIFEKGVMLDMHRRIGNSPYLISVSKIEACDVNTEEDFVMADAISQVVGNYQEESGKNEIYSNT